MRQISILFNILICLFMLLVCTVQANANITVDATLSHLSFPEDRAARLVITVTGASRTSAIELPEIDNVLLHSRGQSSQINMVNSNFSSSISHNYLVQPLQPGKYTIPPIKVTTGGRPYTTKPINFEATAAGQKSKTSSNTTRQSRQSVEDLVFLRISETGSHYPGEIVPITIKAYFRQEYRADSISLPTIRGDGVVMPQLQEQPRQTQESLEGRPYSVLTWDTNLSGIKVGNHPITFHLEASLLIPQKRRSRSPFGGSSMLDDSFFDSFFGNYQRKPISVISPEFHFNVLPLPIENRPDNFTGAIGDFQLSTSVGTTDVEVGEPMTLTMEISGTGNFDRVEAPVFPESPNWKIYAPTSAFSEQENSHSGTKKFEQAVVAKSSTVSEIPSLAFSYFDPRKKNYITRSSLPIAVRLKQSSVPNASQTPQTSIQPQPQQAAEIDLHPGLKDLAPIHLEPGTFQKEILPVFKKSWFIVLCAICLLLLLVVLFVRLYRLNIDKHPEIQLQRYKKLQLESDLKKVEQAKLSGDGATFFSHSRTAIQNQLGLLWNMEPAAISLADVRNKLKPESNLIGIFKAADEAAYGSALSTEEEMQNHFIKLKGELEELL